MFFISFSVLWSFCYFYLFFHIIFIFSLIIYLIPSIKEAINYSKFKSNTTFEYLSGFDLYWIFLTPLFLIFLINFSWTGPSLSAWFGNMIFQSFQYKMTFLILFFFFIIITTYTTSLYFSSREVYDYLLTCFNFFLWVLFLFFSNTIFTVIFFIEILSTLIFLLLITSTFSTAYFYNNLNLNLHNYFKPSSSFYYLQVLLFFFWSSLLSSINFFFFLIIFYIKFLTFDWFLFEYIFHYVINASDFKDLFYIAFIWLNLLFCIFLKCGLAPFYIWKPVFFKGIPFHALFFYILFFYFFIFLFFIHFFIIYLNEIFYFFLFVNVLILLSGFLVLLFILCEAYYLKTFLALSSILNSLFVFLALSGTNLVDCFFFL